MIRKLLRAILAAAFGMTLLAVAPWSAHAHGSAVAPPPAHPSSGSFSHPGEGQNCAGGAGPVAH
jgi:hypothetical protein